ncbi:MAG TPA: hypothetical protein VM599_01030 [Thermoanaerobaculia bacterium]|nr:hypothetical protein [Thermoanaerobaculia bacterium]
MRVMVMIKANEDSEADVMPGEQQFIEMGRFNQELVEAEDFGGCMPVEVREQEERLSARVAERQSP